MGLSELFSIKILKCISYILILSGGLSLSAGTVQPPHAVGPVPTANQLNWQDMEMYAFIHYSLNTYTDQEWGYGNESPELLTPSSDLPTSVPSIRMEAKGAPLCIRAWDYDEEALVKADHPFELERGQFVNLNIDHNLHGVGGVDTWGRPTLEPYTIHGNEPHQYSFMLNAE